MSFGELVAPDDERHPPALQILTLPFAEPRSLAVICRDTIRRCIRDVTLNGRPAPTLFESPCSPDDETSSEVGGDEGGGGDDHGGGGGGDGGGGSGDENAEEDDDDDHDENAAENPPADEDQMGAAAAGEAAAAQPPLARPGRAEAQLAINFNNPNRRMMLVLDRDQRPPRLRWQRRGEA